MVGDVVYGMVEVFVDVMVGATQHAMWPINDEVFSVKLLSTPEQREARALEICHDLCNK